MKFIIAILLTVLLGFALPLYFWWWSFAVTAFLVAVIMKQSPGKSFLAGFIAIALLWAIQAALLDAANNHLLSGKVAVLLPFGGSRIALLLTTAIIGGLVSGMAALTGSYAVKRGFELKWVNLTTTTVESSQVHSFGNTFCLPKIIKKPNK